MRKLWERLFRRRRAVTGLRLSEDRFRLMVDSVKDYAIFMLDPQGRVATWNAGAERLKGYRAGEIIGRHFSTFYPKEAVDRGWPDEELRRAAADGRFEDEGWRVRKDGTTFWANVVITALRDEAGTLRGFGKVTRDLTERRAGEENARRLAAEEAARKAAEEAAREVARQREQLHVTLASIGDAVIVTDTDGAVTFLNPVAAGLTGWALDEAAGQPLERVFPIINEETRQAVENPVRRVFRERRVVELANHTALVTREGREVPVEDSAAPIRAGDGVAGAVLVFRDVTEARRAMEARTRLAAIVESSDDAIVGKDLDGVITSWNKGAERLYGYTAGEAVGRSIAILFPPERPDELPAIMGRVRRGERVEHYETVRVRKDGTRFDASVTISPIRDAEGRVIGASKVARDITDRRRAEEAVRASEARFRQLADAMPQIVWTAGPDGVMDYSNRRWYEYTGSPVGVGNESWGAVVHPDDMPAAAARWADCVRTGEPFEMELRLREGRSGAHRWHLVRTVPVRDAAGAVARWYGTATDIDGQKRAGEAARFLAEASAALATLVDYESTLQKVASLAVPYFADWAAVDVATDEGPLRRLAVAHRDPEKVRLAEELFRRYPPDPDAPGGVGYALRTGRPQIVEELTDEVLVQGAQDEEHLRQMRALGLRSYICVPLVVAGRPMGVLTFATAESGRRYAPADLALAEDLAHRAAVAIENANLYRTIRDEDRRKTEFLALLAHELRNPLAPLRNGLQVLRLAGVDREAAEQARALMERQLAHLVRLVDDLLDVSRISRGKLQLRKERIPLAAVVRHALEVCGSPVGQRGHELEVSLPEEPVYVDADRTRLAQAVCNLLSNAVKYSDPGTRIRLTARREGDEAVIRVKDAGVGIPPGMLTRVFELFTQVDRTLEKSQGGLGVGLAIVRRLAELHGGSAEAHSEGYGRGSEFVIRLPLLDQEGEKRRGGEGDSAGALSPSPPLPLSPSGPRRRVLVVDDNADAADSLGVMLGIMGHDVRTAHDGLAGVEAAAEFRPEVVLLDIGMPRLNGYDACRRIREQPWGKSALVVALTGWGQEGDKRRSREAGFDAHLVKPVEPATLERLLAGMESEPG